MYMPPSPCPRFGGQGDISLGSLEHGKVISLFYPPVTWGREGIDGGGRDAVGGGGSGDDGMRHILPLPVGCFPLPPSSDLCH